MGLHRQDWKVRLGARATKDVSSLLDRLDRNDLMRTKPMSYKRSRNRTSSVDQRFHLSGLRDYTGKWTKTVAISDNGPSDPDYFGPARLSEVTRNFLQAN